MYFTVVVVPSQAARPNQPVPTQPAQQPAQAQVHELSSFTDLYILLVAFYSHQKQVGGLGLVAWRSLRLATYTGCFVPAS